MKVVEARERQAIAKLSKDERIEVEDAEVISLARELSEELVSGDAWLAKVAKAVGVRVVWTTTLVLMARRQGLPWHWRRPRAAKRPRFFRAVSED